MARTGHRTCRAIRARGIVALGAALLVARPCSAQPCIGDCDGGGAVTVDEVVVGVNIALGLRGLEVCRLFDRNASDAVEIDELITAADYAQRGCPIAPVVPTVTATDIPPATASPEATGTPTASPGGPTPASACVAVPGMFVDCFRSSGLDAGTYEGQNGAAVADIDGDGFPDVYFWNPTKRYGMPGEEVVTNGGARLFRNLGHGMRFEVVPDAALGSLGPTTTVVAAAFGDLDNDGQPDLVVSVGKDDARYVAFVFRNRGGGAFENVSEAWGFAEEIQPVGEREFGVGLSLVDLNLDGRLDVVQYRRDPEGRPLAFLSQPDGTTWQEAGRDIFGDARGLTWTLLFTDWNRDQLLDVFVMNDFWDTAPSKLYLRVDAALRYEQRHLFPLFSPEKQGAPMGGAAADLNGDGELDVVVTDTGDQRVYSSASEVGEAWGVKQNPSRYGLQQNCWSVAVPDVENDGRPDLFFTCAGFRFTQLDRAVSFVLRNSGETFDVAAGVLPNEEVETWEEGLAVADFDQDGRLDLLTGAEGSPPRLLWNQIPGGHALAIRLKGRRSNAQGIGARVDVEVAGLPTQAREMFPGGATWGYSDAQLLFGLGEATAATVTVDWRPAGGTAVQTVDVTPGAWVIEEP